MHEARPLAAAAADRPAAPRHQDVWWLVLCLVGLDYFSTLAYLPSLAVRAAGEVAPLAAAVVAAMTWFLALPLYLYIVGRSPHGRGSLGLLERTVPGWRGKLLILMLLAFVATDYVVTRSLSLADAAQHISANPLCGDAVRRLPHLGQEHLALTLLLAMLVFAFWMIWKRGAPHRFLWLAAVVVIGYLALSAIVITIGLAHLAGSGAPQVDQWRGAIHEHLGSGTDGSGAASLLWSVVASVPYLVLGLSGFELTLAVVPLVRGDASDEAALPRRRIRNARKVLFVAAAVMVPFLVGSVFVTALLVPPDAVAAGGAAQHRALAYLAHGGPVAGGDGHSPLAPIFSTAFGTLYDFFSVAVLCLAGAGVAVGLQDFVPEYLMRFGMEFRWAWRLGVSMHVYNVLILIVTLAFRASVSALQWVYATSVLVLLAGTSLAACTEVRSRWKGWRRRAALVPAVTALGVFSTAAVSTAVVSRAGLEIAMAFVVGLLSISFVSRWLRSTELRFQGFEFADDQSRRRWDEIRSLPFQILVPNRPGGRPRAEKALALRRAHRLPPEVPVIFIEAELGDPSDFYQAPLLRIEVADGIEVIEVTRCVSIAHVLASMGLACCKEGQPPEMHFGWSEESPLAANLNFLLFGQGNIPWMVLELFRKGQPDPKLRPRVLVG
jgi:hypothetical protein